MQVYLITNIVNGKRYVGQSINSIDHRWGQHISHAKSLKNSGALMSAIRKYGSENFKIKIISKCNTMEEMNYREQYYIKIFKTLSPNGYNLDSGGKNSIMHDDTKKKLSIAHKGKKRGPFTEEHRRKISKANKGQNLGGTLSEATRLKISIANSGKNSPMFGKKQTQKNKDAVSKANIGNKYWAGKKHAPIAKNKISKAKNKYKKKIYCINNDTIYESIHAASRDLKVGRKEIGKNIAGNLFIAKGFIFKKV